MGKLSKAIQRNAKLGKFNICFTIFPYQLSLGLSLGCFEGLRIRLYVLCFKIAIDTEFKKMKENNKVKVIEGKRYTNKKEAPSRPKPDVTPGSQTLKHE